MSNYSIFSLSRIIHARYRPFIKPIRGPLRIAKRGGRKDAIIAEALEKSDLARKEHAILENQRK